MDFITGLFKKHAATDWMTLYSPGVELKPLQDGVLSFDFPQSPNHVNYLLRPYQPVSPNAVVRVEYRIAGLSSTPVFKSVDGGPEVPTVRPMLQVSGDDWQSASGRWWSNPECGDVATGGIVQLNVPLQPFRWSNVEGKAGQYLPDDFNHVLQNLGNVALTFGGHFFGHGVYVANGAARFELLSFKIT